MNRLIVATSQKELFLIFYIISNPIYNLIPHLLKILEVVPAAGKANRRSNQVKSMYCVVFTVSHLISWHRLNPRLSKQLSSQQNANPSSLSSLHQTSNRLSTSQESEQFIVFCHKGY